MIQKGLNNESIVYSYLSIFYSVRLLLIDKDGDSDDNERILELIKKYYEPLGWTSVNIIQILKETKAYKDIIEDIPGLVIDGEEAKRFYKNASLVLDEVLIKMPVITR